MSMHQTELDNLLDTCTSEARRLGASYSDLRLCTSREQRVHTREDKVQYVGDNVNQGFGVRVLVQGTWGFAASSHITKAEVQRCVKQACEIAAANSKLQVRPIELSAERAHQAAWKTPLKKNPFEVPLSDKIELLQRVNATAKTHGADYCDSFMWIVNDWKYFGSSEGSSIVQDLYRLWSEAHPTVVDKTTGQFDARKTLTVPTGQGYEYIENFPYIEEIEKATVNARRKLKARSVTPGKRDLIILPSNLWLTIHESCGHPTELDRALGYEANFAGTSFMTPDKLGKLQYGSELINMFADRTAPAGLSTCGYDDDGVATLQFPIIKDGLFVNYQTTREQAALVNQPRSYGCSYADSWGHVPLQRMPNISLQPGKKKLSLQELISGTDDAILVIGDGSWSIDQQRYNFQFTGQEFWEIKNGKIGEMLRDVAYQGNTVDFWNSCDALCDESEYELGGSFFCGKGQPCQVAPVSHGAVPARFRQVNILNTRTKY